MNSAAVVMTGPELLARIWTALGRPDSLRDADKYRMQADPILLRDVVAAMAAALPPDTEVLAGLELGGVPLAVALSLHSGLPSAIVRRTSAVGGGGLLTGTPVAARRTVLVVDMLQGGGKIGPAVDALRAADAEVSSAVAAVCWHPSAGIAAQRAGVELLAVVTADHVAAARATHR